MSCFSFSQTILRVLNVSSHFSTSSNLRCSLSAKKEKLRPLYLPYDQAAYQQKLLLPVDSPPNSRLIRAVVIGAPNSGKSSVINSLMGLHVAAASSRVHTTRKNIVSSFTEKETQIVLWDTPGFTSSCKRRKHRFEKSLLIDPYRSLAEADVAVVLVDASDKSALSGLRGEIIRALSMHPHLVSVLAFNKMDEVRRKGVLLPVIKKMTKGSLVGQDSISNDVVTCKDISNVITDDTWDFLDTLESDTENAKLYPGGWNMFREVFLLSATRGDGIDSLKTFFMKHSKPSDWLYHSSLTTVQDPKEIISSCIWSKLLDYCPQEVPYSVSLRVIYIGKIADGLQIITEVDCPKKRSISLVLGRSGVIIDRVTNAASEEMEQFFGCKVNLNIKVRMTDRQ